MWATVSRSLETTGQLEADAPSCKVSPWLQDDVSNFGFAAARFERTRLSVGVVSDLG